MTGDIEIIETEEERDLYFGKQKSKKEVREFFETNDFGGYEDK